MSNAKYGTVIVSACVPGYISSGTIISTADTTPNTGTVKPRVDTSDITREKEYVEADGIDPYYRVTLTAAYVFGDIEKDSVQSDINGMKVTIDKLKIAADWDGLTQREIDTHVAKSGLLRTTTVVLTGRIESRFFEKYADGEKSRLDSMWRALKEIDTPRSGKVSSQS